MTSAAPPLVIAAINCRGVKGRVDKINEFLRMERGVSVMVLSETWLREGEAAPRFEGSEIVVDERGVVSEGASRASGGLLVLARLGVQVKVHRSSREMAVLSVGEVRVIGCYFSPYTSSKNEKGRVKDRVFREHWETLEGEIATNPDTVIVGDFNAHGLQDDLVNYPRGGFVKKQMGKVIERVVPREGKWTTFNLQGGKGINDHVFVALGNPMEVDVVVHEKESLGGSDHRLLTVTVPLVNPMEVTEGILRWDLKAVDRMKERIHEELINSNPSHDIQALVTKVNGWARGGRNCSLAERVAVIDEGWTKLQNWLQGAILKHTKRKKSILSSRRDFLTPEMLKHRKEWQRAEAAAQEATLRGDSKETLQRLWRVVGDKAQWWTKRLRKRRATVFSKIIDSMLKAPGNFQKMVSSLKKKESRGQGRCRLDPDAMDTHAAYFESTFGAVPTGNDNLVDRDLLRRTDPHKSQPCGHVSPVENADVELAAKIIRQMPNHKAAGSDEIPGELWKLLTPLEPCIQSLVWFFHICEATGVTPSEWKVARVIPVFKNKGDASNIANYRPIALTQVIRRIYEKYFIQKKLLTIVDKLARTQGGFRPHRSTYDQVVILHEILCRLRSSAVIFLDIKAAYDTVDRRLLWTRMGSEFKVPDRTIAMLRDMFDSNVAMLAIKGKESEEIPLLRGLLQGSSISPLLFNVFINDLLVQLQKLPKISLGGALWNHLFFADDGALVATNNADANKLANKAHGWGVENGIIYAIEKCKFIGTEGTTWSIKMKGVPLEQVGTYKYLGIHMAPRGIDFMKSLQERATACLQMVQWMSTKGLNTSGWRLQQSITVYKSFLRSMMEYGFCLKVLAKKEVEILQKVQNSALRSMLSANKSTSIGAMHLLTEIEPLAFRNAEVHARFFNSLFNGAKKDLPSGQLVQNLYSSKGPKGSLVQAFKTSSPWVQEVIDGKLPSLPDMKKLRTVNLCKYQASLRDAASGHILPPRGPSKNNLLKWSYRLPRYIMKELYCFKLGKFPRQECFKCKGIFTAEHLFKCGRLQHRLEELTVIYNFNPLIGKGAMSLHDLLRRLDTMKKPPMEAYQDIGEALLEAKSKTLSTQFAKDEEAFSDDDRPEDPYNILIEKNLGSQCAIRKKKVTPSSTRGEDSPPSDSPTRWIRGDDLTTVTVGPPPTGEEIALDPPTPSPQRLATGEVRILSTPETAPTVELDPPSLLTSTTDAIEKSNSIADDPLWELSATYALFIMEFMQWNRDVREAAILGFLTADDSQTYYRTTIYNEFQRHCRARTIWTTREGVKAASTWIEAFRFWDVPELKIEKAAVSLRDTDLSIFDRYKKDA